MDEGTSSQRAALNIIATPEGLRLRLRGVGLFHESFGTSKELSFKDFPWHCFNCTRVQFSQSALYLYAPCFLDIRVDFRLQTLYQQTSEGGSFLFR